MNVGRTTLHTKIKIITGASTKEIIQKIKFDRACEMLHSKEKNISEIAFALGFGSLASFSAAFKNYTGRSPKNFIKNTEI